MSLVKQMRPMFKRLVRQSFNEGYMAKEEVGLMVKTGMLTPDDYSDITGESYPVGNNTDKGSANSSNTNSGSGTNNPTNGSANSSGNSSTGSSSSTGSGNKSQSNTSEPDTNDSTGTATNGSSSKSKK